MRRSTLSRAARAASGWRSGRSRLGDCGNTASSAASARDSRPAGLPKYAHEAASTFALFTSGHQYLRRRRLRHPARRLDERRLHHGYLLSVDELAAIAPVLPGRGDVYRGLGYADLELEKSTLATGELEQAVRIDNTDTWSWESLGTLYAQARQWDKAWDAADQLIRLEPDAPDGWRLRAQVQMEQPRDGLAATEQAFAKRFGNRADEQATLKHMRDALAHLKH